MYRVRPDATGLECLNANDGSEWISHAISRVTDSRVWHISPNRAGTRVLFDSNHPDEGIYEIAMSTGQRRHVCLTESRNGGSQWARDGPADPYYPPGEDMVTFTSDSNGHPQVYVAEKTATW